VGVRPVRMVAGFLTVGGWTLMGFVRDAMIAAYLGAGPVADAFWVAFGLPNLFRRFFAEGAFNTAFVPLFSKKLEQGEGAKRFAEDALSGLAAVVLVLSVVAIAGMPVLVLAMAGGFWGDARFDLAVDYGRICFPYIVFISLVALFSGLLNAGGRFVAAAGAPVLLNAGFIVAMVLAARAGWDMGLTLAWATPVTGALQLALVWWAAARMGYALRPRWPQLTPEIRRMLVIAGPAVLAGGVVQINLLVGRQVASFTEGAISWLSYADRLYQLPLGVVGIAIGIVLLPELSRRLAAGDPAGGRDAFNRATEFALFLTLPAAVALVAIAVPLVSVLFGRGTFGADDIGQTALALAIYGVGLPAFVLQKVLQPLYFAREDTRRPFRFAVWSMVVNAGVAVGLMPVIGFIAAALATTVAGWTMAGQLWRGAAGMGEAAAVDDRLRARAVRMLGASLVMGAVLLALTWLLAGALVTPGLRYLALAGLVGSGMAAYGGAALALGAVRLADLRGAVRRHR